MARAESQSFLMQLFTDIENFLHQTETQGHRPLIAVLGPTASGKTALSLEIARHFHGEIISADSRQFYKFMNIGTEKIQPEAMQGIPHHLVDFLEPDQEFTLADFKRLALKTIDEIHRRKHVPLLVGGTGLYFNAVLQNYQIPAAPPNPQLRQELDQIYREQGAEALHNLLQKRDPAVAAKIHPQNVRYVIRALEILSAGQQKEDQKGEKLFEVFYVGIDWPREILYDRINRRVDQQVERGLIEEVSALLAKGYNEKLPSMSSLGYPQIIAYLKGECSLEQALDQLKQATRNYAKRQMTWFRRYPDIHWVKGEELESFLKSCSGSA